MVAQHAGRTFDWSARFDPLSLNFRAAASATTMPTRGRLWKHGPVLDQGAEGACVGMGSSGAVAAAPSSRAGVTFPYALNWYRRAQRLDEWQGEAYSGTSVNAGCKVGRERKLWSAWRWAKNPAELATGILSDSLGPAIVGVQWGDQLYETDPTGLLPADAELDPQLGHCVLLFGYLSAPEHITDTLWRQLDQLELRAAVEQLDEPSFPLLNSWGRTYGRGGRAVAPLTLVRRWFASRGEFALPENRTKGTTRMTADEHQDPEQPATDDGEDEPAGDVTLHLTAADLQERDRILDPPDELGQESVTVRSVSFQRGFGGRLVQVSGRDVSFPLRASTPVTVRRPQ